MDAPEVDARELDRNSFGIPFFNGGRAVAAELTVLMVYPLLIDAVVSDSKSSPELNAEGNSLCRAESGAMESARDVRRLRGDGEGRPSNSALRASKSALLEARSWDLALSSSATTIERVEIWRKGGGRLGGACCCVSDVEATLYLDTSDSPEDPERVDWVLLNAMVELASSGMMGFPLPSCSSSSPNRSYSNGS